MFLTGHHGAKRSPTVYFLLGLLASLTVAAARPNLVFIYTDDQGPWTIGANGYAEYDMRIGAQANMRGIRTDDWKLMVDFLNPGRAELYDLQADADERQNLYPPTNERTTTAYRQLHRQLLARIAEVNNHSPHRTYGITVNFGATILGTVAPGKAIGAVQLPFANNVTKPFRDALAKGSKPILRSQLYDSYGQATQARLVGSPEKFVTGDNPFQQWNQVFMAEAVQFERQFTVENLPVQLADKPYRLLLYSSAPISGTARINGALHQLALVGDFSNNQFVSGQNYSEISGLSGKSLTVELPADFKLAGFQIILAK